MLLGGLGATRDALGVAALRAAGIDAQVLPAPSDAGLARARALGNHGQCNPAQYAVGAVLERARACGERPADFARRHAWLVPASCGPCRLAAFPLEWARVLEGSGLAGLHVELFDQFAFVPALEAGGARTSPARGLLLALVAADVLEVLGHRLRPFVDEPDALTQVMSRGAAQLAAAFEARREPTKVLRAVAAEARALPTRFDRVLPRVLLVGEPWTTLTDGDPSYAIASRLAEWGAEVDAPTLVDWLRSIAWQRAGAPLVAVDERRAAARAVRGLGAAWRLLARAAGLDGRLEDPARLGALAAPWYPAAVRGGSSFLEVGRALAAAEGHTAHLVLSLKPFGCLPSSALSDGVLAPILARRPGAPAFLSLETSGDSHASVDSRLEMALHAASLRAVDEFDEACARRGRTADGVRAALRARAPSHPAGARTFACTAAELVARGACP
jgi:predicted nucleotide-binding protein (sugar kinase/HSP70/actin superfamily)